VLILLIVYILYYIVNFSRLTAVLGKALDAIHNQVIRHNPFIRVFNKAYNNQAVRFNVQDAYLKSDITNNRLT
jgi:hypothetical protein